MNTKKDGRPPVYANSLKIAIAREYLTGHLGYHQMAVKHGIGHDTVHHFVRWYKKHYSTEGDTPGPEDRSITPQKDNDMAKELKQANLKIMALEMLIENAQKELGIDLVKKLGTKQSPK